MTGTRGGKSLRPVSRGKILPERQSVRIAGRGGRSTGGRAPKRKLNGKVKARIYERV